MFSDLDEYFYKCDRCEDYIPFDKRIWIFSKFEGPPEFDIEVLLSSNRDVYLLALCAQCGCATVDFERFRNALRTFSRLPSGHKLAVRKEGYCDSCGAAFNEYGDRITISCTAGDIHLPSNTDVGTFFPSDTEAIWTCCRDCGMNFDNDTLRNIFMKEIYVSPFEKRS